VIEPRQLQSQRMFTGFVIDHEIGKAIQHSTHFSCSARKPFGQIADWARVKDPRLWEEVISKLV
jgi:hypothetical protein